jgi:hypothetical protein
MEKVQRRIKRDRVPTRSCRARIHYVKPDSKLPFVVQVFISPTQAHMRAAVRFRTQSEACSRTAGMVRHYFSKADGRFVVRPGQVIAHMFLNAADLRLRAAEIVAHECTHAALAWGRLRKAKLKDMDGEEVVCYSVGVMTAEVNRIGHMMGVWK